MSQGIYLSDGPIRRPQPVGNPLLRKIQRSCRLSLPEPDLALNLDVADYINEKQGPAPRDAVIAIVKLINSRDTHTAVFALALLDVLVKNCGYPLHLQVSRKEFLNELVKRFPEHPPMRYSKVQRLVLTAIEEWYQTICKHSSYKEDLGYIRDMHRLLKYKGYIFPKINESDMAVLRPAEQLKTPSEIQKEQEVAQAAKLEELIRRGRPEDLREANKLMKIMAGFKEDNAREAKQAILTELNKLKRKADLLNEMLASSEAPDLKNETVTELHTAIKGAQPKFQKIIEEEHEDDELVQDLLKFNDTVNQLLRKFELLKVGDSGAASQIRPSNISSPAPATGGALATEINLIDFDDEAAENGNPAAGSKGATAASSGNGDIVADLLGDLSDLSFSSASGPQNFGLGGSIQLGATQPAHPVTVGFTSENNSNLDLPTAMSPHGSNKQFGGPQSSDLDVFGEFNKPSTKTLVNQSSNLKIEANLIRESKQTLKVTFFFSNMTSSDNTPQATKTASNRHTPTSAASLQRRFTEREIIESYSRKILAQKPELSLETATKAAQSYYRSVCAKQQEQQRQQEQKTSPLQQAVSHQSENKSAKSSGGLSGNNIDNHSDPAGKIKSPNTAGNSSEIPKITKI